MNRTRAAAARTHAVFPLSVNGASAVTKVIALMARTLGGRNFRQPRPVLQPCQQPVGAVSGWFPAPWPSGWWTAPTAAWTDERADSPRTHVCRPARPGGIRGQGRPGRRAADVT